MGIPFRHISAPNFSASLFLLTIHLESLGGQTPPSRRSGNYWLDAQRAVRTARHRAAEWNLDPHKIGIVGYSAGANLAMNLAANFDAGDPDAADPIERHSSRPDFAVGCGTWHWRKKESPFGSPGLAAGVPGARRTEVPMELVQTIKTDLEKLGVPVRLEMFEEGGHGVGNLIPTRVNHGFPPAKWPKLFLQWYESPHSPRHHSGSQ